MKMWISHRENGCQAAKIPYNGPATTLSFTSKVKSRGCFNASQVIQESLAVARCATAVRVYEGPWKINHMRFPVVTMAISIRPTVCEIFSRIELETRHFDHCLVTRYAVAEWYEAGLCDREVAGSTPARGCCVPTPTQRAIPPGSVNE